MKGEESDLLKILQIANEVSIRGQGISIRDAIARARYRELRTAFEIGDLVPLIKAHKGIAEEWLAYSEDKRTSGGYALLREGRSIEEAVADYAVREMDYWVTVCDATVARR